MPGILHITHKPPFPKIDGGCYAMAELTEILSEQPLPYCLLSFSTPKHPFSLKAWPERLLQKVKVSSITIDTRLRKRKALSYLLKSGNLPLNIDRFFTANGWKKIQETILEFNPEWVIFDGIATCAYFDAVSTQFAKIKCIYRAHNVEYELWEQQTLEQQNSLKRSFYKKIANHLKSFEQGIWQKANQVWSISAIDAFKIAPYQKALRLLPMTLHVASNHFKPVSQTHRISVGFIGALDWEPNVQGLKWFIHEVWIKNNFKQHAQLLVAGKKGNDAWLKSHRSNGVKYLGQVTDAQGFISELDVFIAPLFSGSGIRVKILEAMSLSVAVLTTSKGAQGLDDASDGALCIANSADKFSQALHDLITNEAHRSRLAESGFAYINQNHNRQLISANFAQNFLAH